MSDSERVSRLEAEVATLRELIDVYEETVARQAAELEGAMRDLRRSNQDLDQFAYAASHDLKTPLRGIGTLAQMIEEDLDERLTPEAREHLALLRSRITRMEALINGILEYSRVGRAGTPPEKVDSRALVQQVVDLIGPPPGLEVEARESLPVLVADRARLAQVLMNLVANAVKYHHAPATGRVVVSAEDAGSRWRFTVADDGPGIAPEFHERIFGMFQRLETRDKVEGAGLGLALVRKVVERAGGMVTVESDVGKGARFHFTWPKG